MEKLKHYFAMILGGFLTLLAVQNIAVVELNILFWSFNVSRILIIVFALLTGVLIGWVFGGRKKTDLEEDKE